MLEAVDISLSFPVNGNSVAKEVLNHVNVTLEPGKFYAITGPNGGGKTSLAKVIMGIYQPSGGRLFYKGEDITELSVTERARRGIAYAFQQPPRFKGLRVRDLLRIANHDLDEAALHGLLRNVGLCFEDYIDREVDASLSGGEMKRIEIATLLARQGEMTIYDEPEAGVDLWTFHQLVNVIINQHHKRQGTTLVITHNERFLMAADEVMLVADGEIRERGKVDKIWPLIKDDYNCQWRNQCGGETNDPNCIR